MSAALLDIVIPVIMQVLNRCATLMQVYYRMKGFVNSVNIMYRYSYFPRRFLNFWLCK